MLAADGAELPAADPVGDHQVTAAAAPRIPDTKGRHRIMVELKKLEQEAKFLEKDLDELENIQRVSTTLQELLRKVDNKPDPLLPETLGPASPCWDQWFEGSQDLHSRGCCIL